MGAKLEPVTRDPLVHPSAECEPGAFVGEGSRIWRFSHVTSGARIGRAVSIGQGCFVAASAVIGDGVRIQNGVSIFDGVTLDEYVFCGPGVVFTNVLVPRVEYPASGNYLPTHVKRGASLGANATILSGITIGQYAIVGAGAVVTRDVPDFAQVVGNPARQTAWVSRRGAHLIFSNDGQAACPSGELYALAAGVVRLLGAQPA
jgi:UDP-2-acetamido-3-amino-2,3-dideoxy-glucuronate N-acetyltransferase